MFEIELYKKSMDSIRAPEALYTEVLNMTENNNKTGRNYTRRLVTIAVVAALLLALSAAACAVAPSIFGWGGNLEISPLPEGNGFASILHTESLTDPVYFEDERMIFIVNNEKIDITGLVSRTEPYLYEYNDEEGIIHYWIIGKNGTELENYGYAEFLYKPGESWIGGYSARTNIGPDGKSEPWLENGKDELGIPW